MKLTALACCTGRFGKLVFVAGGEDETNVRRRNFDSVCFDSVSEINVNGIVSI